MERQLVIDGIAHAFPHMQTMTMGEARVLKRYTGKALEEIEDMPDTDPDLIAAICHVALMRADPDATFAQIEARVDEIGLAQIDITETEDEAEDEARPPVLIQNGTASDGPTSGQLSDATSDDLLATNPPLTGMAS